MVHMYCWKVIIVSLFAPTWLSVYYTLSTLSKFLQCLHCPCNFLDVVFFPCCGPSCITTWEIIVLKMGKESLSIVDKIILLVHSTGQTFIHSLIYSNGNKHSWWCWSHARHWGCNGGHVDIVSPSWALWSCNCHLLSHSSRVVLFIWLIFFHFSMTPPTRLPQTQWTSLRMIVPTPRIFSQYPLGNIVHLLSYQMKSFLI